MQQAASVCHQHSISDFMCQHIQLLLSALQPGTWLATRELQAPVLGVMLLHIQVQEVEVQAGMPLRGQLLHLSVSLSTLLHLSAARLLRLCLCTLAL